MLFGLPSAHADVCDLTVGWVIGRRAAALSFPAKTDQIAHSEPVAGGRNLVLRLDGTSNELGRNRTYVAGLNAVARNCWR